MARRSSAGDPRALLEELRRLLDEFHLRLEQDVDLRAKVRALIPAVHTMRDLGSSLLPVESADAARDRILLYMQRYLRQIIPGDELLVISGIGEWGRRLRELRVEYGWNILSGSTVREMLKAGEMEHTLNGQDLSAMRTDDYILLSELPDRDAAYRWNVANSIRKMEASVQDKILEFLLANVGQKVTGEELRYIANGATEWARRVRELRTEQGWPVFTKQTGRPDLGVGEYVLEADRQSEVHDRHIKDEVRREVLMRDHHSCTECGWSQSEWSSADPRFLELHHVEHHQHGGENVAENLVTLCNVCHDRLHRS